MDADEVKRMQDRFSLNMRRITGLILLAFKDERERNPKAFLTATKASADLFRLIVVFLHAAVEDQVRSIVPKGKGFLFYAGSDIDKAIKRAGLDPAPLTELYKPLSQLAKRRGRIVHEADFESRLDTAVSDWGVTDFWLLTHWLIATIAFNYRLLELCVGAHDVFRQKYANALSAMEKHREFGMALTGVPANGTPEEQRQALANLARLLDEVLLAMKPIS